MKPDPGPSGRPSKGRRGAVRHQIPLKDALLRVLVEPHRALGLAAIMQKGNKHMPNETGGAGG